MSAHEIVCTACACLCDDIKGEFDGDCFSRIENACAKGATFVHRSTDPQCRACCTVGGEKSTFDEALQEAIQLIRRARKPLIFGLDNSTSEAQSVGIKLAQTLGAVIDDTSSFCQGALIQTILNGNLPTCSFSEVNHSADLLIYWGSNPHHSHPRHLSEFCYYPHETYRVTDQMPNVVLSCIEVRDTETSRMCHPVFKVKPGGDGNFMRTVLNTARGEGDTPESKAFFDMIGKSNFCVIFVGLGLTYSLDGQFQMFEELVQMLQKSTRVAVIPMVGHFNMRGFNHLMQEKTGYANRVSFADGVSSGDRFSFIEQVSSRSADCILIAGSDPFLNLPQSLMKNLYDVPLICLDPFVTETTHKADVVLATALSGLEVGGNAIRMDGQKMSLVQAISTDMPSDEVILQMILDKVI